MDAGAGAEARLGNTNWLARVEYLHYDFGSRSLTGHPGARGWKRHHDLLWPRHQRRGARRPQLQARLARRCGHWSGRDPGQGGGGRRRELERILSGAAMTAVSAGVADPLPAIISSHQRHSRLHR